MIMSIVVTIVCYFMDVKLASYKYLLDKLLNRSHLALSQIQYEYFKMVHTCICAHDNAR